MAHQQEAQAVLLERLIQAPHPMRLLVLQA
jgi:hypothetical protein